MERDERSCIYNAIREEQAPQCATSVPVTVFYLVRLRKNKQEKKMNNTPARGKTRAPHLVPKKDDKRCGGGACAGRMVGERKTTDVAAKAAEEEQCAAGRGKGGRRATAPQPARRPPTSLPARPDEHPVSAPTLDTTVPSPRAATTREVQKKLHGERRQ